MIERTEVDGRAATVCYLMAAGFKPAEPDKADLIKLIFDDGEIVFLTPPATEQE